MEREIIRLESLRRAALASPAPTAREKLVAETLLDCLRELHAAAARMARDQAAPMRHVWSCATDSRQPRASPFGQTFRRQRERRGAFVEHHPEGSALRAEIVLEEGR